MFTNVFLLIVKILTKSGSFSLDLEFFPFAFRLGFRPVLAPAAPFGRLSKMLAARLSSREDFFASKVKSYFTLLSF